MERTPDGTVAFSPGRCQLTGALRGRRGISISPLSSLSLSAPAVSSTGQTRPRGPVMPANVGEQGEEQCRVNMESRQKMTRTNKILALQDLHPLDEKACNPKTHSKVTHAGREVLMRTSGRAKEEGLDSSGKIREGSQERRHTGLSPAFFPLRTTFRRRSWWIPNMMPRLLCCRGQSE